MKVVVDYDLCEANAVCMKQAPEVFRVEEDDTLTVLITDIPEDLRGKVEEAVRLCPRQAIKLEAQVRRSLHVAEPEVVVEVVLLIGEYEGAGGVL